MAVLSGDMFTLSTTLNMKPSLTSFSLPSEYKAVAIVSIRAADNFFMKYLCLILVARIVGSIIA